MMGAFDTKPTWTDTNTGSCPNCGCDCNSSTAYSPEIWITYAADVEIDHIPKKQKIIHNYNWDLNYKKLRFLIPKRIVMPLYHLARDRI